MIACEEIEVVALEPIELLPLPPSQLLKLKLKHLHQGFEAAMQATDPLNRGSIAMDFAVKFMELAVQGLSLAHEQIPEAKEAFLYGTVEDLS